MERDSGVPQQIARQRTQNAVQVRSGDRCYLTSTIHWTSSRREYLPHLIWFLARHRKDLAGARP